MNEKELFEKCLKFVLQWEGGISNHPADSGGLTNKGITQTTYTSYLKSKGLPQKSVIHITYEELKEIYYKRYWLASGCEKMSPKFAALCFDTAVNMGTGVVKATGMTRNKEFLIAAEYKFPDKYIAAKKAKYYEFVKAKPSQKVFLQGWLNRLSAIGTFIQTL